MLNAFVLLHFVQRPARSSHIEEAVEVCFSYVCFAPRTCNTHRPHLRRHTTVYFTLRKYKSPQCLHLYALQTKNRRHQRVSNAQFRITKKLYSTPQ